MRDDRDFNYRKLTPEQWVELTGRVRREAHAARAQSLQTLCWAGLVALRSAGAAVRRLTGRLARLFAARACDWWAAHDAWLERRRAVRALGALDDRSLKDMGLHRSEIEIRGVRAKFRGADTAQCRPGLRPCAAGQTEGRGRA